MRIEDPVDIFSAGHMHDPDTERVAVIIPEHLRQDYRSKGNKGLPQLIVGTKERQSADMDVRIHITPPEQNQPHEQSTSTPAEF
jgi:hypothetical protein